MADSEGIEAMPNPEMAADIFDADGALSRAFLLARGYCCGNGCRNCPYGNAGKPVRDGNGNAPPRP
jgi:hypothetical protein